MYKVLSQGLYPWVYFCSIKHPRDKKLIPILLRFSFLNIELLYEKMNIMKGTNVMEVHRLWVQLILPAVWLSLYLALQIQFLHLRVEIKIPYQYTSIHIIDTCISINVKVPSVLAIKNESFKKWSQIYICLLDKYL